MTGICIEKKRDELEIAKMAKNCVDFGCLDPMHRMGMFASRSRERERGGNTWRMAWMGGSRWDFGVYGEMDRLGV